MSDENTKIVDEKGEEDEKEKQEIILIEDAWNKNKRGRKKFCVYGK